MMISTEQPAGMVPPPPPPLADMVACIVADVCHWAEATSNPDPDQAASARDYLAIYSGVLAILRERQRAAAQAQTSGESHA